MRCEIQHFEYVKGLFLDILGFKDLLNRLIFKYFITNWNQE